MRMLRIHGKTLKDKINNEKMHEMTDVERLEEFLKVRRLRWMGNVETRQDKFISSVSNSMKKKI